MFRFIHLADVHLGARPAYLGDLADERGEKFMFAFKRVVDFACDTQNDINAIVIAGDFFDSSSPAGDVVSKAVSQFRRLKKSGVEVILTPGNHDPIGMPGSVYLKDDSGLKELIHICTAPNVEFEKKISFDGQDVYFYGMAWEPTRSEAPFDCFQKNDEDGIHIAIIHGTLTRARFAEFHDRDVPLDLENLQNSGMDYIALGHLHAPQEYKAGKTPVVYPGTLEGKRFTPAEEGNRYLHVVTLAAGKKAKIEKIKWNTQELRSITLNLDDSRYQAPNDIVKVLLAMEIDNSALIRLTLQGTPGFMFDTEELLHQIEVEFVWVDLIDETDVFDSALIDEWRHERTIRGLFVSSLLSKLAEEGDDAAGKEVLEIAMKMGVLAFDKSVKGAGR